jgi:hypothetical protein
VVAGIFLLLVLPPLADLLAPRGGAAFPRPVPVEGVADYSYPSLELLWSSGPDLLPDVSDYLAHRAYQEGLTYGRSYGFPAPDERVRLSRYRANDDGTYSQFSEEVLVFDDAWIQQTLQDAPLGIGRLLVTRIAPSGVVLTPERGLYSVYPLLWQHTVYVVLVLLPLFVSGYRSLLVRVKRSRVAEIAGRRKQVA